MSSSTTTGSTSAAETAKEIAIKLPSNASVISNQDGLLGGIKLWGRDLDE